MALTFAALVSGGAAWATVASSGGALGRVHATDVTDSSSSTDSTGTTDTSSTDTSSTETSSTTDTTVVDTSTTESTTTTIATTTTTTCKPGWGYGDKNHCHSGPPGLTRGHGHHH